jgi:phosphatidylserine decarboxylase
MNVFNVHSNRCSVNGLVKEVQYFPGQFVNAALDKASVENERNAVVIEANGQTVTLVQVAGLIARRILCYIHVGEHVKPLVSVGEKVSATRTALARLPGLD